MMATPLVAARGRLVIAILAGAIAAGLAIAPAKTALAEAGADASRMGHEASGISPPGSSDEFPGGMPALRQFIGDEFSGVPQGAIYSTIAKLHGGSHEACDEALE